MPVLITGGTGFIGSHTVAALHRAGRRLRLLVRDPAAVPRALTPLGLSVGDVEVVEGDVRDPVAARRGMAGCEAVVHAASVYSFDSRRHRAMRQVNVDGTRTVLTAALRAGVDRVVHVSSFGALLPSAGPLRPGSPVGRPRERYMATKAAADAIAREHQRRGEPVTISYPLATLGPNDPHLGDQVTRLRNLLLGRMPVWPSGGYPVGDVRDVAALHVEALTGERATGRLFAPGRYVSTREYVQAVREATGRRLPVLFLPAAAVLPVGIGVSAVQHVVPWHIPAEYGAIYTCLCEPTLAPGTASPATRTLTRTMADTVDWLYRSGRISRRAAGDAAVPAPQAPAGVLD